MTEPKPKTPNQGRAAKGNALAVTHGAHSYLRTGRLLPSIRGRRRIARQLNELRAALMESVPGSDDPRKAALIGQVVRAEGFGLILESYLKRFGVLKLGKGGGVEAQPAMATIIGLMHVQRQALMTLGMDRREVETVKAPYEIIEKEKDGPK